MDRHSLEVRIRIFRNSSESDDFIKSSYGLKDKPNYKWYISESRKKLQELKSWEKHFTKILYRPFDERWIYYHPTVVFWPRPRVMQHIQQPNLALVACRQYTGNHFFHALVANALTESCYVSNKTREIGYVFPLYLYDNEKKQQIALQLKDQPITSNKQPNIDQKVFDALKESFGNKPTPEDIFYYIYAVLYSNTYRKKYQEFLKIDFPRIPFTKDYKLFQKLSALGSELVDLHLLKHSLLSKPIAKFYGEDGGLVEKREYNETQKRVYINDQQYFEEVEPDIWNYFIGGYQVLDKWLKDRKGRYLSSEDIKHYCRVVTALAKTVELQENIDKIYEDVEKQLIKFENVN